MRSLRPYASRSNALVWSRCGLADSSPPTARLPSAGRQLPGANDLHYDLVPHAGRFGDLRETVAFRKQSPDLLHPLAFRPLAAVGQSPQSIEFVCHCRRRDSRRDPLLLGRPVTGPVTSTAPVSSFAAGDTDRTYGHMRPDALHRG
jgi:hypothetical protein